MASFVTKLLHHGLGWWCVLGLDAFEFFLELILPDVVEMAQAIDLTQSEFGLAQISQARLAVVLGHILIGARSWLVQFVQYHVDI